MTALRLSAVLIAVMAAVPLVAAAAERKQPPRPGLLWQKYPLGTTPLTGTTATAPRAVPAPVGEAPVPANGGPAFARQSGASSGSSDVPIQSIALGAAGAMFVLACVAMLYLRSRRGVLAEPALAAPLSMIMLATERLENRRRVRGREEDFPVWNPFQSRQGRRAAVRNKPEEPANADGSAPEDHGASARHTDVAGRVADVIRAAEELGEQIRADAHEEALQIKHQAEESHTAAMRELAAERDQLRSAAEEEAAEIRRTGEIYATDHRRAAEAEAAKLVEEAEVQARAMREAAEQMAMRIETNALERREELEERTRVVEARLRRFQGGLAKMSEDLDELLEPGRAKPDDTLLDALDVDQLQVGEGTKEDRLRR